jgi:hypothetical protein
MCEVGLSGLSHVIYVYVHDIAWAAFTTFFILSPISSFNISTSCQFFLEIQDTLSYDIHVVCTLWQWNAILGENIKKTADRILSELTCKRM